MRTRFTGAKMVYTDHLYHQAEFGGTGTSLADGRRK